MESCTVTKKLEIIPGTRQDYESVSPYHYREHNLGPYAAIYAMKGNFRTAAQPYFDKTTDKDNAGIIKSIQRGLNTTNIQQNRAGQTVGVIVYSMPAAGAQLRRVATGGLFDGLDRSSRLKLINKNIRTISRVIIEPRFRSLGLATRLVKETMPLMSIPFIEALAVMGRVNPFFEKAGMTRYDAPVSASCARLIEALAAVGIDEQNLIDPLLVQQKLDSLSSDFIEMETARFLQCYGQRRFMPTGIERTRFILSKLTDRPVYYFWKNPNIEIRI